MILTPTFFPISLLQESLLFQLLYLSPCVVLGIPIYLWSDDDSDDSQFYGSESLTSDSDYDNEIPDYPSDDNDDIPPVQPVHRPIYVPFMPYQRGIRQPRNLEEECKQMEEQIELGERKLANMRKKLILKDERDRHRKNKQESS